MITDQPIQTGPLFTSYMVEPDGQYVFSTRVYRTFEGDADKDKPDTRPTVGTKCVECGYTNDSTAWYCGVCGVSLA